MRTVQTDGVVAPPRSEWPGIAVWSRGRRARFIVAGIAVALIVSVVPAVVAFLRSAPAWPLIAAESVPQGVSQRIIGDRQLFFVRDRENVRAFLVDAPHPTASRVQWCAEAHVFVSWPDASVFDRKGRVLGGPAPSGMFPVRVQHIDGGRLLVGDNLTPAPPEPRSRTQHGDVSRCWIG